MTFTKYNCFKNKFYGKHDGDDLKGRGNDILRSKYRGPYNQMNVDEAYRMDSS